MDFHSYSLQNWYNMFIIQAVQCVFILAYICMTILWCKDVIYPHIHKSWVIWYHFLGSRSFSLFDVMCFMMCWLHFWCFSFLIWERFRYQTKDEVSSILNVQFLLIMLYLIVLTFRRLTHVMHMFTWRAYNI